MAADEASATDAAADERRAKIEATLRWTERVSAWAEAQARYEIAYDDVLKVYQLVDNTRGLPTPRRGDERDLRYFVAVDPLLQRSLAELLRQTAVEFDESAVATERWQVADAAVRLTGPPR